MFLRSSLITFLTLCSVNLSFAIEPAIYDDIKCDGILFDTKVAQKNIISHLQKSLTRINQNEWKVKKEFEIDNHISYSLVHKNRKLNIIEAMHLKEEAAEVNEIVDPELICEFDESVANTKTNEREDFYSGTLFKDDCKIDSLTKLSHCDYEWTIKMLNMHKYDIKFEKKHTVTVGVADTGYTPHPELGNIKKTITGGWDVIRDLPDTGRDPLCGSCYGHGTGVISVLQSPRGPQQKTYYNNRPAFVTGVSPSARVKAYRVSKGSVIHFSFHNLTKGILKAVEWNRKTQDPNEKIYIINMSLGGPFSSKRLEKAIDQATKEGIILTAAAGNYLPDIILNRMMVYPAKYKKVLAITAVSHDANPWIFSSMGKQADIAAPGNRVWVARTVNQNDIDKYKFSVVSNAGTSLATALTSGALSLWIEKHGNNTLKQYDPYRYELVRYIFEKLEKANKLTPFSCHNSKGQCDEIKKGLFGKGILNIPALLEEPLPSIAEFKKWLTVTNRLDLE